MEFRLKSTHSEFIEPIKSFCGYFDMWQNPCIVSLAYGLKVIKMRGRNQVETHGSHLW